MRILHVLGKLDRGGVETWLVQLLKHIDRRQYQMDFIVHTTDPGAYDDEVRALGSRIIPCLRPKNPIAYAANFRRILREYGPYDVVHSHVHHFSGYVLALAATAGVPVRIAHSHNDTRMVSRAEGAPRRAYKRVMQSLIYASATGAVAVSEEAKKALFQRRSNRLPIQIQHLGIDLSQFSMHIDRRQLRKQLRIPSDAIVIGHVGRFYPQKNHTFFVDIAQEVIGRQPQAFFLLVGDGPLRKQTEQKVAQCGLTERFRFAGIRSDVPALMVGAMDLFLFPSVYEGLPITVLEMQGAGLRGVLSDAVTPEVDVVPELIVRERLQSSPSRWAERLLQLCELPNRISRDDAHRRMISRSIAASARQLTDYYGSSTNH